MKRFLIVAFAVVALGATAADAEAGCRGGWRWTPIRNVAQRVQARRCCNVVYTTTCSNVARTQVSKAVASKAVAPEAVAVPETLPPAPTPEPR